MNKIGLVFVVAVGLVCGTAWFFVNRSAAAEAFSLEEAELCLLDEDKRVVGEAVELIKKYEAASERDGEKISDADAVLFDKALAMVRERYAQARKMENVSGRMRAAALAWVVIDFTYNNATGTCACWVAFAAQLGLAEAQQMMVDPPEKLRGYLLPPEQQ